MNEAELFRVRLALIQAFLREHAYDGVLLSRADNFAMATGGKRNYVNLFSDMGACALFVSQDGAVYFVGNTIEAPRLLDEELAGFGCEVRDFLWFESSAASRVEQEFSGRLASDDGSVGDNVHGKLAYVRSLLTPVELEKYERLGRLAAEAMETTLEAITPGMAEPDIAAMLVAECNKRHCHAPVALIAADDRIAKYRHPVPTVAPLLDANRPPRHVQKYVMVVAGVVREGLSVSLTRFKRFGALPADLDDACQRICAVDALMQEATRPGVTLGDVFAVCQQAYKDHGFRENEWHYHHQGGATGYAARTCKGSPGEAFPVLDTSWGQRVKDIAGVEIEFGQAFAWNPSGIGVKSEDTFLLYPDGSRRIISMTPGLPQVDLEAVLGRPTEVVKSGMAS